MDGDILAGIPVSPEAYPPAPPVAEIKTDARTDGLTDEQIDAGLAACNAELHL